MKKPWKDLEKSYYRIDVGSTRAEAMSSSTPASTLFLTTDGYIIINGQEIANARYDSTAEERLSHAVRDDGATLNGIYTLGDGSRSRLDAGKSPDLLIAGPEKPNILVMQANDPTRSLTFRQDGNYFFMIFRNADGSFGDRPFYIDLGSRLCHVTGHLHQVSTSDRRTKDNLNDSFSALEVLRQCGSVYEYDYNSLAGDDAGRHSYGLIAQNVESVPGLASTVGTKPDGMKYINYIDHRFTALLIKSVTELADRVQRLETVAG